MYHLKGVFYNVLIWVIRRRRRRRNHEWRTSIMQRWLKESPPLVHSFKNMKKEKMTQYLAGCVKNSDVASLWCQNVNIYVWDSEMLPQCVFPLWVPHIYNGLSCVETVAGSGPVRWLEESGGTEQQHSTDMTWTGTVLLVSLFYQHYLCSKQPNILVVLADDVGKGSRARSDRTNKYIVRH